MQLAIHYLVSIIYSVYNFVENRYFEWGVTGPAPFSHREIFRTLQQVQFYTKNVQKMPWVRAKCIRNFKNFKSTNMNYTFFQTPFYNEYETPQFLLTFVY